MERKIAWEKSAYWKTILNEWFNLSQWFAIYLHFMRNSMEFVRTQFLQRFTEIETCKEKNSNRHTSFISRKLWNQYFINISFIAFLSKLWVTLRFLSVHSVILIFFPLISISWTHHRGDPMGDSYKPMFSIIFERFYV